MTKATWKRKIQNILSSYPGFFEDQYWLPIQDIFKRLKDIGCEALTMQTDYDYSLTDDGVPISKTWLVTIEVENYSFFASITAHGAGSIGYPLDRYDISAYICR